MQYLRAVGVLIAMCGLLVAGQASAGHMGHRHTTLQLESAWARRAPSMAPGRAKWRRWRCNDRR